MELPPLPFIVGDSLVIQGEHYRITEIRGELAQVQDPSGAQRWTHVSNADPSGIGFTGGLIVRFLDGQPPNPGKPKASEDPPKRPTAWERLSKDDG